MQSTANGIRPTIKLSFSFYLDSQLAASRSIAFNTSRKLHSTLTPTRVEASTAVSMGSVPDPFFPPQYKRKKVVWLRETNSMCVFEGTYVYVYGCMLCTVHMIWDCVCIMYACVMNIYAHMCISKD